MPLAQTPRRTAGTTALAKILRTEEMSQGELAQRSGVSREYINQLCRGRTKIEMFPLAVALAWALQVPLTDLEDVIAVPGEDWPIGPSETYIAPPSSDWVVQLERGHDPWIERSA